MIIRLKKFFKSRLYNSYSFKQVEKVEKVAYNVKDMQDIFKMIEELKKGNNKPLEALAEYYKGKAEEHKSKANFWLVIMLLSLVSIVLIILI